MFNNGTRRYFDLLPQLEGLEPQVARRLLSAAYADVLVARDGFRRDAGPAADEVVSFLRRVASALEAHAVFEANVDPEHQTAAAFVAAEAISLLDELLGDEDADELPRLQRRAGFEAVEAGLLYLIAGFDSNAELLAERVSTLSSFREAAEARAAEDAADALVRLMKRRAVETRPATEPVVLATDEPLRAVQRGRGEAYRRITAGVDLYMRWLTRSAESLHEVQEMLQGAINALSEGTSRYSDVAHLLRLLDATVSATMGRALRSVPGPSDPRYLAYIDGRSAERPLMFPSGLLYAEACLPGPSRHAAVALPTGSGKSFIAEVAAAQAALEGWVLYLVPTNALASQVRRELSRGLRHLPDSQVRSFMGDGQYTELTSEVVADVATGQVLVMTPEKCALALRLSPEAFADMSLCVFDECHLISERGGRGVVAELVAAHILALAPRARFLLLSAMISNPETAAAWLARASGVEAEAIAVPWRPTRTMRGVITFTDEAIGASEPDARETLERRAARQKNLRFPVGLSALVNLQGAWTELGQDEYALLDLGVDTPLTLNRRLFFGEWEYTVVDDGYVNSAVSAVTSELCRRGERVLAFVPRSRHDPFVVAASVETGQTRDLATSVDGRLASAYLRVAEADLGAASPLSSLLQRGVAVHSSTLLDAERSAAELAYQRDLATAMVATGTLAQGLNLPATAVIVGGTKVGYEKDEEDTSTASRVRAQLLNAIGRAGRAGFANHGIALVVPNTAARIVHDDPAPEAAISGADVLRYEDASTPLQSRLQSLVAGALEGSLTPASLSLDEMAAYTYLPAPTAERDLAERILVRTLALTEQEGDAASTVAEVAAGIATVGRAFVEEAAAPDWTTEVAYLSGLPLPEVFALYRAALGELPVQTSGSIIGWTEFLIRLLRSMPRRNVQNILAAEQRGAGFLFGGVWDDAPPTADEWDMFAAVWRLHLQGASISEIALAALPIDADFNSGRSAGTLPIPKTIILIQDLSYRLSMTAGALAALFGVGASQDGSGAGFEVDPGAGWELSPEDKSALEMAPLALRSGCGTRDSLAWFRFGIRYRAAAHALGRVFPVPDEIVEDDAVAAWIRRTRRAWLEDEIAPADHEIDSQFVDAIRSVMRFEAAG